MANPEIKQLGEGIATARPDKPLDDRIRITYVPSEEGLRLMRSLGRALFTIDSQSVEENLDTGRLGVSDTGEVWRRNEDGRATKIADNLDIYYALEAVKKNGDSSSLHEYENKQSGKRILVQSPKDNSGNLQLWLAKNPKDQQILVDAVFCLHFHQPAIRSDGTMLTEEQILQEALKVGITFFISSEGTPLLNKIPRK